MNNNKTKVKICGITNYEDAKLALDCGADALGFVFAASGRRISAVRAKSIIKKLPPFVSTVGVFVNESVDKILQIAEACDLNHIQLHGDEGVREARALNRYSVIKVVRVNKTTNKKINVNSLYSAILLETDSEGRSGGTGVSWDWQQFKKVQFNKPLIVAGGLNPNNVAECIRVLKPYAVDVSSGVEQSIGIKSKTKILRFIKNAKQA